MSRIATPSVVHNASEGKKFDACTTLVTEQCPTCNILFAIPETLRTSALRYPGNTPNGWKLSCPLGHTWWYTGKSEEEKLRERLQREADARARANAQLEQTRAELRGQKARGTRFKNERDRERARVANGVCPCCNRTFQNLAAHMATQHPDHGNRAEE